MSSVTGHAIRSGPAHSPARSFPLNAATTPSMGSAFETSTEFTLACAKGLRTTTMCSIPGSERSSAYFAWPVMSSGSSLRGTARPMAFSVTAIYASPPVDDAISFDAASTAVTMFW
jgi:hypothetical protein